MNTVDAKLFRTMLSCGAALLKANQREIDELNVFPVPDGDTGTNMSMTVMTAIKEVESLPETATMAEVSAAMATGALHGARGNSGVILSQLFRGMKHGLKEVTNLDGMALAGALQNGVETAFKAVMRPKDGTILTVARGVADAAVTAAAQSNDLMTVLEKALEEGNKVLAQTPEMLPVLKEAGVVDAGGKGLIYFYTGMLAALKGDTQTMNLLSARSSKPESRPAQAAFDTESIRFGYCTEFIAHLPEKNAESLEGEVRDYLSGIGDSLVVVADEDVIKVHVHTNHPGQAIEKGLSLGYLTNLKIENMRLQHHNLVVSDNEAEDAQSAPQKKAAAPKKRFGCVSVSAGSGMNAIFETLGVDAVISGGQTMNPSTEDILNAIAGVPAEEVFVFPNNKNIILAAQQAAKLITDKKVYVVPTLNVPQGISAMIAFNPEATGDENLSAMQAAIAEVHTGITTYSIRTTSVNNMKIRENDILGMLDGELCSVGRATDDVAKELINKLLTYEKSTLTIYYGEGATEAEAQALADYAAKQNPQCEAMVQEGGQPVYHYIIAAE